MKKRGRIKSGQQRWLSTTYIISFLVYCGRARSPSVTLPGDEVSCRIDGQAGVQGKHLPRTCIFASAAAIERIHAACCVMLLAEDVATDLCCAAGAGGSFLRLQASNPHYLQGCVCKCKRWYVPYAPNLAR